MFFEIWRFHGCKDSCVSFLSYEQYYPHIPEWIGLCSEVVLRKGTTCHSTRCHISEVQNNTGILHHISSWALTTKFRYVRVFAFIVKLQVSVHTSVVSNDIMGWYRLGPITLCTLGISLELLPFQVHAFDLRVFGLRRLENIRMYYYWNHHISFHCNAVTLPVTHSFLIYVQHGWRLRAVEDSRSGACKAASSDGMKSEIK